MNKSYIIRKFSIFYGNVPDASSPANRVLWNKAEKKFGSNTTASNGREFTLQNLVELGLPLRTDVHITNEDDSPVLRMDGLSDETKQQGVVDWSAVGAFVEANPTLKKKVVRMRKIYVEHRTWAAHLYIAEWNVHYSERDTDDPDPDPNDLLGNNPCRYLGAIIYHHIFEFDANDGYLAEDHWTYPDSKLWLHCCMYVLCVLCLAETTIEIWCVTWTWVHCIVTQWIFLYLFDFLFRYRYT